MINRQKMQMDSFAFADDAVSVTDEGFMRIRATIARVGVLPYRQPDGTVRRELVTEETLRNSESNQTIVDKPVTVEHPPGPVNSENVDLYEVGNVADEPTYDEREGLLTTYLVVRQKKGIDAINRDGLREVSGAYWPEVDETPGVHPLYGPYDVVQLKRHYNHAAITREGRAGPTVALHMDSYDDTEPQHTIDTPSHYHDLDFRPPPAACHAAASLLNQIEEGVVGDLPNAMVVLATRVARGLPMKPERVHATQQNFETGTPAEKLAYGGEAGRAWADHLVRAMRDRDANLTPHDETPMTDKKTKTDEPALTIPKTEPLQAAIDAFEGAVAALRADAVHGEDGGEMNGDEGGGDAMNLDELPDMLKGAAEGLKEFMGQITELSTQRDALNEEIEKMKGQLAMLMKEASPDPEPTAEPTPEDSGDLEDAMQDDGGELYNDEEDMPMNTDAKDADRKMREYYNRRKELEAEAERVGIEELAKARQMRADSADTVEQLISDWSNNDLERAIVVASAPDVFNADSSQAKISGAFDILRKRRKDADDSLDKANKSADPNRKFATDSTGRVLPSRNFNTDAQNRYRETLINGGVAPDDNGDEPYKRAR